MGARETLRVMAAAKTSAECGCRWALAISAEVLAGPRCQYRSSADSSNRRSLTSALKPSGSNPVA